MKSASLLCCWSALLLASAPAADWQIYRVDGRDYVSVENIAAFYGFPAPVPLPAPIKPAAHWSLSPELRLTAPLAEPVEPSATAPFSWNNNPFSLEGKAPDTIAPEGFETLGPPPAPVRMVELDAGRMQLAIYLNSREILINGARQWLAFPTHVLDGRLLVSRLDLAKVIEPRLRPEKIEGMEPVTTVVLDPGHGGHDRGAISRFGSEKDFALDVALRARDLLEKRGYKVIMTRATDVFIPLEERPRVAQRTADSIFVSIHFNASDSNRNARGFEIFSMAPRGAPATNDPAFNARTLREEPGNALELPSAALAGAVYHSLLGNVPTLDRGLKHARFAVLRLSTVPAVLVECGFVTNVPESAQIGSPQWRARVAEAIVEGIDGYKDLAVRKQAPKMVADYLRERAASPGL